VVSPSRLARNSSGDSRRARTSVFLTAWPAFAGDDNGTYDGWPLPSLKCYAHNVRSRFPFLWINAIFDRSGKACKDFTDHSLDAVFIDACHSEESVRNDILCWLPKIKEGGVVFGDD
jgi:Methyltransferase domain